MWKVINKNVKDFKGNIAFTINSLKSQHEVVHHLVKSGC